MCPQYVPISCTDINFGQEHITDLPLKCFCHYNIYNSVLRPGING